jgi:hypothetical protein
MTTKKTIPALVIAALLSMFIVSSTVTFAVVNKNLEIIPQITVNGQVFTLPFLDIPHDQSATLKQGHIPVKLGEFEAPVSLKLENIASGIEYVDWDVKSCRTGMADSKYYIEPDNFDTIERVEDEAITETKRYYESELAYDFEVDLTLTMPNCYQINMRGKDEETGDSNVEENIYLVVTATSGYVEPNFEMEFNHSDISIFDESRNETPAVLAPEFITLTDTSTGSGNTQPASRNWTIEWHDSTGGNQGNATLHIPSSDAQSTTFSYNFNNPGQYFITLEVTGTNGLPYDISKWVIVHKADLYFSEVMIQRDMEDKNFSDFNAKVAGIDDQDLKNLYDAALDGCEEKYTDYGGGTGGWRTECSASAEAMFDDYDAGLAYLDVHCMHFPDLGYQSETGGSCPEYLELNSYDELCRAGYVVRDVDAFQGDGAGATKGCLRPNSNINRIEICAVLNKSRISSGGTALPQSVSQSEYSDLQGLANNDWRKTNAEACTQFEGYPNGEFQPANDINTAETLKVLLGLYGEVVSDSYATDITNYCPGLSPNDWYAKYLALAFEKGFMEVVADNCNPGKSLTRGEVVMLMYRMFYEYKYMPLP